MNRAVSDMRLLQSHAPAMDQVFRIGDLAILLQAKGKTLHDRIARLIDNQLLVAICRGLYGTEGWTLESASARLYPDSFVSGPTMLAEHLMIGTVPTQRLLCIKTGLPRNFDTPQGQIEFHSIQPKQLFGYEKHGFVNKANPERALLDTLYYHLRGEKFFFDLFTDVNVSAINAKLFTQYVEKFRNPKFKAFAHDYYHTRSQDNG